MSHAHLIQFPDRKTHQKAILAFLEVRESYCAFTDRRALVTNAHLKALENQGVPFQILSDSPSENGETQKN